MRRTLVGSVCVSLLLGLAGPAAAGVGDRAGTAASGDARGFQTTRITDPAVAGPAPETVAARHDSPSGPVYFSSLAELGPEASKPGSHPEIRPDSVHFGTGGDLFITDLSWSAWGKSSVRGRGTAHMNQCQPTCAQGEFRTAPAVLTVFHIGRAGGKRQYLCYRVSFPSSPKREGFAHCPKGVPLRPGAACGNITVRVPRLDAPRFRRGGENSLWAGAKRRLGPYGVDISGRRVTLRLAALGGLDCGAAKQAMRAAFTHMGAAWTPGAGGGLLGQPDGFHCAFHGVKLDPSQHVGPHVWDDRAFDAVCRRAAASSGGLRAAVRAYVTSLPASSLDGAPGAQGPGGEGGRGGRGATGGEHGHGGQSGGAQRGPLGTAWNQASSFFTGFGLAAASDALGLYKAIRHPVATAKGIGKAARNYADRITSHFHHRWTHGNKWGAIGGAFMDAIGHPLANMVATDKVKHEWKHGNKAGAIGRGLWNAVSLGALGGAGGAAVKVLARVGKLAKAANKAADVARVAGRAGKIDKALAAARRAEQKADQAEKLARKHPRAKNRGAAAKAREAAERARDAAHQARITHTINKALNSEEKGEVLEGEVARAIREEVVGFKRVFMDEHNTTIGEIDIETGNVIIEVASGNRLRSKTKQLVKLQTDRLINPHKKAVILYAPNLPKGSVKAVQEQTGVRVAQTIDTLKSIVGR